MATRILFKAEDGREIEGDLDGHEGDFLFIDIPMSRSTRRERHKIHYRQIIAEDGKRRHNCMDHASARGINQPDWDKTWNCMICGEEVEMP